jgi:hypothetical protein
VGRPSFLVLLLGALAVILFVRRQKTTRGEHVDLYYEDGSMVSLENGATDSQRLLETARDALRAASR